MRRRVGMGSTKGRGGGGGGVEEGIRDEEEFLNNKIKKF